MLGNSFKIVLSDVMDLQNLSSKKSRRLHVLEVDYPEMGATFQVFPSDISQISSIKFTSPHLFPDIIFRNTTLGETSWAIIQITYGHQQTCPKPTDQSFSVLALRGQHEIQLKTPYIQKSYPIYVIKLPRLNKTEMSVTFTTVFHFDETQSFQVNLRQENVIPIPIRAYVDTIKSFPIGLHMTHQTKMLCLEYKVITSTSTFLKSFKNMTTHNSLYSPCRVDMTQCTSHALSWLDAARLCKNQNMTLPTMFSRSDMYDIVRFKEEQLQNSHKKSTALYFKYCTDPECNRFFYNRDDFSRSYQTLGIYIYLKIVSFFSGIVTYGVYFPVGCRGCSPDFQYPLFSNFCPIPV